MSTSQIKFTILASFNLNGGVPQGNFFASNETELNCQLLEHWEQIGLNNASDEAFLEAEIEIAGEIRGVYLGNFYVNESRKVISSSLHQSDIEDRAESWRRIGFPIDDYNDDDELFFDQIQFLFNPSSPSELLGPWLEKCSRIILDTYSDEFGDDKDSLSSLSEESVMLIGDKLLSSLLRFSGKYGKSQEMFQWLLSDSANEFLSDFEAFFPAADLLLSRAEEMTDQFNEFTEIRDYLNNIADDQHYELHV